MNLLKIIRKIHFSQIKQRFMKRCHWCHVLRYGILPNVARGYRLHIQHFAAVRRKDNCHADDPPRVASKRCKKLMADAGAFRVHHTRTRARNARNNIMYQLTRSHTLSGDSDSKRVAYMLNDKAEYLGASYVQ